MRCCIYAPTIENTVNVRIATQIGRVKKIEKEPEDNKRLRRNSLSTIGPRINANTIGDTGNLYLSIKYPSKPKNIMTSKSNILLLIE